MTSDQSKLRLKEGKKIKGAHYEYRIVGFLGSGGSGVVYRARCEETNADVAIKFFIPFYEINLHLFEDSISQQNALQELEKFHVKELQCLRQINHAGIVRVLDNGSYVPLKNELAPQLSVIHQLSFFVMDLIPGTSIGKWFQESGCTKAQVSEVLSKICDALIYLHEVKQYLHADLRAANILIRDDSCEPVIIDFALYKNFNFNEIDENGVTKLAGDWDLFPKNLPTDDPLKKIKETSASRKEMKALCFPWLDLFQMGKLFSSLENHFAAVFPREDMRFIELVRDELTSWERVRRIDTRWLKQQLLKLDPSYSQFMGVDELTTPSSAKVTLQLPGTLITVSPLIDQLANTRSFRRLRSINQLVFLDAVYPGAGYRRHLHCLRAYSYCANLLGSLTHSPNFRLLFNPLLARQALAVSLLHDINHFPFLHIFQETRGDYIRDIDLLDLFCNGKATQDNPSIYQILEDEIKLDREQFKNLMLLSHHKLLNYTPGLQIVKSMVDSGADVDKLAYLKDDSLFTGVAYGHGVDAERLLSSATVVELPTGGWHLAFREEGLSAIESLVMARYWMFRTVYWHRVNRAIMAMLLHVIRKLYVEAKSNAGEFIVDTMWLSEESVLRYLDDKYKARFGSESISRLIVQDQRTIYRRLLSVQGASQDRRESELYDAISNLDLHNLELCRTNLATELADYLRTIFGSAINIGDDDVLFDIPGRRLDTAGPIYVKLDTGEVRAVHELPGPIQRVITDFERLAKRMRVFIHPNIAQHLDPEILLLKRSEILDILERSLPQGPVDQVK